MDRVEFIAYPESLKSRIVTADMAAIEIFRYPVSIDRIILFQKNFFLSLRPKF